MAERDVRARVHSKLTVVPGKAVAPGKIYPLANLDHMMELHNVRLVYYYKKCNDINGFDLVTKLKTSLSAVLSSYPAVCGRMQRRTNDGNWEIRCSDAGVRVLEATVDMTLDQWLQNVDRSSELSLCYWEAVDPEDPYVFSLAYVQFNLFQGGGLAIGLSCGHMLADPSCATLIMKAWGESHRRAQVMHPPFFHPPALKARPDFITKPATTATNYHESTFKREITPSHNFKTLTLKFSDEMVRQCISEVQSGIHKYEGVTAFEALSALFWVSCTKAKGLEESKSKLSICTEFRKIIIAPLPHGFFGNAIHFSEVCMSSQDLLHNYDLSYAAKAIHDDIFRLEREELRSVIDWLEKQKNKEGKLPPPSYLYGPNLTAINGEGFFTYEAVFEEDFKPLHVAYYVEPVHGKGLIFVLPSAQGNLSRTVMLTLPEDQMSAVCKDPAILRFNPTVWMKNNMA